jgi:disulfide bond formation protein DsbB
VLVALAMVWAVRLGVYHAGAEWGYWPGPTTCATPAQTIVNPADLMSRLATSRVVDCTVAAWRFAGLSLAGWNVVIAAGLAVVALAGAARSPVRPT